MYFSIKNYRSPSWLPSIMIYFGDKKHQLIDKIVFFIVFRPGSIQNSGFKKSKRRRFSKNKSQRVATGFFTETYQVNRVAGSHHVFSSPVFSSTRPDSNLGSVGSRVDSPDRILKLWSFLHVKTWKVENKLFKNYFFLAPVCRELKRSQLILQFDTRSMYVWPKWCESRTYKCQALSHSLTFHI